MSNRILLIDDDVTLAAITAEYLEARGYGVDVENNAEPGLKRFKAGNYAICLLDISMPMKDGFALAEEIREVDSAVPIVFLTGNTQKEDRIRGLSLGADDYITKPFSMEELYLRIRNLLKRAGKVTTQAVFNIGKYTFDSHTRSLSIGDDTVRLSDAEAQLLHLFCTQTDGLVSRDLALQKVWRDEDNLKGRSLNVYINKLRKRLSEDPDLEILNVYGTGYQLVTEKR